MPVDIEVEDGLTEMVSIDAERIDGVTSGANGFPALMIKAIAERDKEPGVTNPPENDVQKENPEETPEETTEAVEPQEDANTVQKELIDTAIAKAMEERDAAIEELRTELAKVKATPIPGGPVMTVPASVRVQRDRDNQLAKAAYYERMATEVNEPDLRAHYQRAAEAARSAVGT